jgi:hypothetical protein
MEREFNEIRGRHPELVFTRKLCLVIRDDGDSYKGKANQQIEDHQPTIIIYKYTRKK